MQFYLILDSSSLKNPEKYINFIDYKITKIKDKKIETDDWDFPEKEIPPHKLKQKLEENELAKKYIIFYLLKNKWNDKEKWKL